MNTQAFYLYISWCFFFFFNWRDLEQRTYNPWTLVKCHTICPNRCQYMLLPSLPPRRPACALVLAVGPVSKALIDVRLWASTPPLCFGELVPRGLKSESCRATPCHLDTADLGAGLSARTAEATKCRTTTFKLQLGGEGQHTISLVFLVIGYLQV